MAPVRSVDLRVFALLLAVIVLVPLAGVALIGSRMVELGPVQVRSQQSQDAEDALRVLSDQFRKAVDGYAAEVEARIDDAIARIGDTSNLAMFAVADPAVDLAVIYASDGRRLFPGTAGSLFTPMQRQVARSAFAPLETARALLELQSEGDKSSAETWTLIGATARLDPARCWRGRADVVACVVFDRQAMTDALVASLEAHSGTEKSEYFDFVMIDEVGSTIWPSAPVAVGPQLAVRALSSPWSAWRLEARLTDTTPASGPSWRIFGAAMVVMLAAIGGLASYIFLSQRARLVSAHRRAVDAAQISHELRTPLTNLGLYGDLIRARAKGDQAITDYCDVLDAETKRLGALVEDATAIARGRLRAPPLIDTGVPDEAVGHLLARYRPMLEKSGGRIMRLANAGTCVRYDRAAFERILINFLDNARKYAPGTQIDVETWMDDASLYLAVRDHGAGIPAKMAEVIFDQSVHANPGPDGHGLGLALCRHLARTNGGDVVVEDGDPGARFVAWIRTEPGPFNAGD